MNEKIKQLAEQAGFRSNPDIYDRNQAFDIPGFAELIVTECVSICEQAMAQGQHTRDLLQEDELAERMVIHGAITQAEKLAQAIRQHFGVEP